MDLTSAFAALSSLHGYGNMINEASAMLLYEAPYGIAIFSFDEAYLNNSVKDFWADIPQFSLEDFMDRDKVSTPFDPANWGIDDHLAEVLARHCSSEKKLVVRSAQHKTIIEKKLGITCLCVDVPDELIKCSPKNPMHTLLPGENSEMSTSDYPFKDLIIAFLHQHDFDVKPEMVSISIVDSALLLLDAELREKEHLTFFRILLRDFIVKSEKSLLMDKLDFLVEDAKGDIKIDEAPVMLLWDAPFGFTIFSFDDGTYLNNSVKDFWANIPQLSLEELIKHETMYNLVGISENTIDDHLAESLTRHCGSKKKLVVGSDMHKTIIEKELGITCLYVDFHLPDFPKLMCCPGSSYEIYPPVEIFSSDEHWMIEDNAFRYTTRFSKIDPLYVYEYALSLYLSKCSLLKDLDVLVKKAKDRVQEAANMDGVERHKQAVDNTGVQSMDDYGRKLTANMDSVGRNKKARDTCVRSMDDYGKKLTANMEGVERNKPAYPSGEITKSGTVMDHLEWERAANEASANGAVSSVSNPDLSSGGGKTAPGGMLPPSGNVGRTSKIMKQLCIAFICINSLLCLTSSKLPT
uniref:Uncharacterized protein n=1 Tax=Avena sativa TaxID=4498 RepID=A0ACD5TVG3_AVESA